MGQLNVTNILKLSLIQMSSLENDLQGNIEKVSGYIEKAVLDSPDIIVLPEFFNHEYFFHRRDAAYFAYAESDSGPSIKAISALTKKHRVYIVATLYELEAPGLYYDTALIINPQGEICGKYRKTHPAAVRSLEKLYFKGGSKFPVFDILGWKIGISICYDNFFPETLRILTAKGAELVLAPFATAMIPFWEQVAVTRAVENGIYYAACNKVGQEIDGDDWTNMGRSTIVNPFGNILSQAGSDQDEIISAELDRDSLVQFRQLFPALRDRRPEIYTDLVRGEDLVRELL